MLAKQFQFEVLTEMVMKDSVFGYMTPCNLLKIKWSFGLTYRLHLQGIFAWLLSFLEAEATCSSKTLVTFQRTTQLYISEDTILLAKELWNMKINVRVHPTIF
jgi:hypothetical protein